jgi:hypothetical protein
MHLAPGLELLPAAKPQAADLFDDTHALDDLVWRAGLQDDKEHARFLEQVEGPAGEHRHTTV